MSSTTPGYEAAGPRVRQRVTLKDQFGVDMRSWFTCYPGRPDYFTHWGGAFKYAASLLGLPIGDYPHSRPPQAELPDHFELVFGTPHGVDLASLAAVHDIPADRIEKAGDLLAAIEAAVAAGGVRLVIVTTDRVLTSGGST